MYSQPIRWPLMAIICLVGWDAFAGGPSTPPTADQSGNHVQEAPAFKLDNFYLDRSVVVEEAIPSVHYAALSHATGNQNEYALKGPAKPIAPAETPAPR